MNLGLGSTLLPGDPRLIDHIVGEVKSQGIFDQFRKECIADVDTKPAYQNLRTRVESSVNSFLSKQRWRADLNKNQLRETLRKHISDGPYLDTGVERIVDQVVNPKIYSVFMPQVEDVVYEFLGLEKPRREKNGACGFKDLLPKDLDPVSPESDKNSLKDISLDSVDANLSAPLEDNDSTVKRESEAEVKMETKLEDFSHLENDISNGKIEEDAERSVGEPMDLEGNTPPPPGVKDSVQSEEREQDDEDEEEEEDSPVFEPIDIMNLNESNISNDSHLSGISELTSHRSRSLDFSNELSRDHFDFSNQDSQLSKVSSDSRLSIVTDFGSSNQPTTPLADIQKDENSKDKFSKDNFKAIRGEGDDSGGLQMRDNKIDGNKQKESLVEMKDGSDTRSSRTNLSSKESSRDGMERIEHRIKEKRSSERSKVSKEGSQFRESRSHRNREKDKRKSSHSEGKAEGYEKYKSRDKSENSRDSSEKVRDTKESKDTPTKLKEEKPKESPSKEGKDLKDIYKEKIRELREKKELTEKEKLGKEGRESSKDTKSSKEGKDKRDPSRDKEKRRNSSSRTRSSRHESRSSKSSRDDSKSTKTEKEKNKREESHRSKDSKSRSQSESNDKSDKSDKSDPKKSSKSEKEDKPEVKQDVKSSQKSSKRDSKSDSRSSDRSEKRDESKDKRRKEEKKSKSKDDHSSLRKGSNDRRSSDRDGSSGSSGRGSQKSSSSPSTSSSKPSSSSLVKDSSTTSNSNSETSDGLDDNQTEESKPADPQVPETSGSKIDSQEEKVTEEPEETNTRRVDPGHSEISLPLKKRPLQSDDLTSRANEAAIKKPKFARNFAEAKKMMKIRKKIEREHLKDQSPVDGRSSASEVSEASEAEDKVSPLLANEERAQIIEVKAENEDVPCPGTKYNPNLEEGSKVILAADEILNTEIVAKLNTKSTLSEMESSIRQSLTEMISDRTHEESTGKSVETVGSHEEKPSTSGEELKIKIEVKEEIEWTEEEAGTSAPDELDEKREKEREQPEKPPKKEHLEPPDYLATPGTSSTTQGLSDDEEDVRYFLVDNERLNRFTQFMNSIGLTEESLRTHPDKPILVPESQAMAPPQPKRKYSTSPLSDILLNNSNNNNDGHKLEATIYEEEGQPSAKRKKNGKTQKNATQWQLHESTNERRKLCATDESRERRISHQ
uniref:Bod1 protein n=1 Tax=Fopius arisanus TaxID=64838 RepID=A0A0C9R407_9HYME